MLADEESNLSVIIPARFNGPPNSANGGYASGVFVNLCRSRWGQRAAVTLLAPVPLDAPLVLSHGRRRVRVTHESTMVATVSELIGDPGAPDYVSVGAAQEASGTFSGRYGHPFSRCFVCGPERSPGDGLRLTPGRVKDLPGTVACSWFPGPDLGDRNGVLPPELVWCALDCPGGWACGVGSDSMVLYRISGTLLRQGLAEWNYIVVGRLDRSHGRTASVSTALYREDGLLIAKAGAQWVRIENCNMTKGTGNVN